MNHVQRKQLELLSRIYLTKAVFSLKGGIFSKLWKFPPLGNLKLLRKKLFVMRNFFPKKGRGIRIRGEDDTAIFS